jgi:hypothetical protein
VGPSLEMEVREGRSDSWSAATEVPRWVATDVAMSGWCASTMLGSLEWDRLGGRWSEWLWSWSVAGAGFQGDGVLVMGLLQCSCVVFLERDYVGGIVVVSVGVQLGLLGAACWWSLGMQHAGYWWCHGHPHNWSSGGR